MQKAIPGLVLLYLAVLVFASLFHFHEDEDHHTVSGETYHSHSLPFGYPLPEHDKTGLPSGDELQLLQIVPQLNRIRSFALDNQTCPVVFLSGLNPDTAPSPAHPDQSPHTELAPNIPSPQWDNYILYATSISPPPA